MGSLYVNLIEIYIVALELVLPVALVLLIVIDGIYDKKMKEKEMMKKGSKVENVKRKEREKANVPKGCFKGSKR